MILTFLKLYWKQLVIGLLIAALAFIVMDWRVQGQRIDYLTAQNKAVSGALNKANERLGEYEKAADDQRKAHAQAEQKRLQVISSLTQKIGQVRQQEVPKKCEEAIDFAVQRRSDLSF